MLRTVYIKETQTKKVTGGIMDAYLKCMGKNTKTSQQKIKAK